MQTHLQGQLVRLQTGGPEIDGIVFDVPSERKVVVALVDARRGPVLRTVDPEMLVERDEAGANDPVLRGLIRRTPPVALTGRGQAQATGRARRGHGRSAAHRTTGK